VKAQSSEQGSELARLQGELDGVLSEKLAIEEQASQLQAASTGSQDLIAQKDAQLRALDGEASDLRLQLAALQNQLDQRPTFVAPTDDVRGAMINRCSETVNAQLDCWNGFLAWFWPVAQRMSWLKLADTPMRKAQTKTIWR